MLAYMQTPRGGRNFADRIPFYWKHGSAVQKIYLNDGINVVCIIMSIILTCATATFIAAAFVHGIVFAIPAILCALFPISFVALSIAVYRHPALNHVHWQTHRAEKYRRLSAEDRKKIKPLAKIINDYEKGALIIKDYQMIIDQMPEDRAHHVISSDIMARLEVLKEEAETRKINSKTAEELSALTEKIMEQARQERAKSDRLKS